jgi:hypothetical protein
MQTDGRKDGRRHITKLTVAFHKFATAAERKGFTVCKLFVAINALCEFMITRFPLCVVL